MESNLYIILLLTHTYHQQTTQHRQGGQRLLWHRGHAPNNAPQGTVLHDPGIMEKQGPTRESRLTHTHTHTHTLTRAHTHTHPALLLRRQ